MRFKLAAAASLGFFASLAWLASFALIEQYTYRRNFDANLDECVYDALSFMLTIKDAEMICVPMADQLAKRDTYTVDLVSSLQRAAHKDEFNNAVESRYYELEAMGACTPPHGSKIHCEANAYQQAKILFLQSKLDTPSSFYSSKNNNAVLNDRAPAVNLRA